MLKQISLKDRSCSMSERSMIKRVYVKIKSAGFCGLLQAVYRRVWIPQLEYFSQCRPVFEAGVGLEIGGPSDIFKRRRIIPVYPVAKKIDNCNFGRNTIWEGAVSEGETFLFDTSKLPGNQYVAEASCLSCIKDASYDYVLSSHCIEHLANPLECLIEWRRVLKHDGLILLAVPHKDGTFDHKRPVTSLQHLICDFENRISEDDLTHLDEVLALHDLSKDPGAGSVESFQQRSKQNHENRCLHHHVFDARLVVAMVDFAGFQILAIELILPCHIIVVAKKPRYNQSIDNEAFKGKGGTPCWASPFPSDNLY